MLSSRQAENMLRTQSATARKVYEATPIQEPWAVKAIVQEIKTRNGGNVPDLKVISGCLNDLTDSGLLKRTGRDHYHRAPIRKLVMPTPTQNLEPENVRRHVPELHVVPAVEEVATPTPVEESPAMSATLVASVAQKPAAPTASSDSLLSLLNFAESLGNVGETIKAMAKQIEDLAAQLEEERAANKKKTEKLEKLHLAFKALQSDD